MNDNSIAFITCVNDEEQYEECLRYINNLNIPEGYEIEVVSIKEAESITAGYNAAMKSTESKYKIYLHQDTYIINKRFIYDILEIFNTDDKIGLIGVIGAKKMPTNGIWWDSKNRIGKVYESHTGKMDLLSFDDFEESYCDAEVVDGLLMATQYDISWREDIFDGWHYYDASQCVEFIKSGYKVVISKQDKPWVQHDCGIVNIKNGFEYYRELFLGEYSKYIFPLVSILIPTYNRPEYFKLALDSALNQTYKNIEVFIGDDSTNNETEKLIKKDYLGKYENIHYYHNSQNLGQFENDIKLFEMSNGEFINYLMDDDLFENTKIEKMMNYFIQDINKEISIVTSHREIIDLNGNKKGIFGNTNEIFKEDKIFEGVKLGDFILKTNFNCIGEPTTALFRKNKLNEAFGVFNKREYGCNVDQASWFNLLSNGQAVFINDVLSYFRIHNNQQLASDKMKLLGALDYSHMVLTGREKGFLLNNEDFKTALNSCLKYCKSVLQYFNHLEDKEKYIRILGNLQKNIKIMEKSINKYSLITEKINHNKNLPLVSILIPTYNQTNYLKEALESAINQTYPNIEIIIGDDSTTDEVEEFIKPYLIKYSNINYFKNQKDEMDYGHKNVNELFKRSKGEFVNYLNHDDIFHPRKIEIMVKFFLENPNITLVTSVRQPIDENGNQITLDGAFKKLFDKDTVISGREISRYAIMNNINCIGEPTTVLFRKEYIQENNYGYFDNERIIGLLDLANWINILQYGDLAYISEPLSYFRIHPNQNSNNFNLTIAQIVEWFILIKGSYKMKNINFTEYKVTLSRFLKLVMSPVLDLYILNSHKIGEIIKSDLARVWNEILNTILYEEKQSLCECPICGNQVERFLPYQYKAHKLSNLIKYNVIGSDEENFSCPSCYSHDRERHIKKYFDKLDIWYKFIENKKVLHIAPETNLQKIISNLSTREYICGDLFPSNDTITKIDITNIQFEDEHFDFIICNHVLEHIIDDLKAMSELYRVLKNNGFAILQTPYSPNIKESIEDKNINTDDLRYKIYGQRDHVRIYGMDFFERLQSVGFSLNIINNDDIFTRAECEKYGFNYRENLILLRK